MRGLRAPIDQIRLDDSHLAEKSVAVKIDLGMLTLASSPENNVDGGVSDTEEMDPIGQIVLR